MILRSQNQQFFFKDQRGLPNLIYRTPHYFNDNLVCQAAIYYDKAQENISDLDVENLLDLLATWYDGYCFDNLGKTHVFSTISILGFFKNPNRENMFTEVRQLGF